MISNISLIPKHQYVNVTKNKKNLAFCSNSNRSDDTFVRSTNTQKGAVVSDEIIKDMETGINGLVSESHFSYPCDYMKFNKAKILTDAGWSFPKGKDFICGEMKYLKDIHNVENLVPFAINEDATEYACFLIDNDTNKRVIVIYPFADTENMYSGEYNDINDWIENGI